MKQDVTVELFYSSAWNDHTADVYTRDDISIVHAAQNEQRGPVPSEASLTFQNRDSRMNPANPKGELYGLIGRQTPIRVTVGDSVRFSGKIRSWKPRRAIKGDAWVLVKAAGVLGNLGTDPLRSPMHRSFIGVAPNDYVPHAYWPMFDGLNSDQFASAMPGGAPMVHSGEISFAAESSMVGSEPLPTFAVGASAHADIPAYTATTQWVEMFTLLIPEEPASKTTFAEFTVGGATEVLWRLVVDPSFSPAVVDIETYNSAGTLVNTVQVAQLNGGSPWEPSEAQFFGAWATYVVASVDTGGGFVDHWVGLTVGTQMGLSLLGTADGHGSITGITAYGGNGASFGHFATYIDPAFTLVVSGSDAENNAAAMNGWAGEFAGDRFERLCREEGIASTVVGTASDTQAMGPQGIGTMISQLREIAATDNGMIHDTRSQYGLTFHTGRALYNQLAALELDFDAAELGAPLEPDIDDYDAANDVTAARPGGSSARAVDEDGPLGVNAIGRKKIRVDVNPASDADLPNHAALHLAFGIDPDPRYPKVTVDLDALPSLAADASVLDVGGLIQIDNLPEDLAPGLADLIVNGCAELIGSHRRTITFNNQPGAILSHVGQLDGGAEACLKTSGAELGAAVTAGQTSFNVVATSGPVFTTSPPTGAQIIVGARDVMTVLSINALSDAFTRTVAAGSWGTSTSGHTYQLSDASIGSVNGTQGVLALSTTNVEKHATADLSAHALVDLSTWLTLGVTPTGAPINWGLLLRYTDVNNYYWADAQIATTGVITLRLIKRVAGVATQITTTTAPVAHSTTVPRVLRAMYDPSTGTFASRIWSSDATEPTTWQLSTTDTAVPAGTRAGVIARLQTGNTNVTPVSFLFDNLGVYTPQLFTVDRGPGPSVAHAAGASVQAYRPLRLTL